MPPSREKRMTPEYRKKRAEYMRAYRERDLDRWKHSVKERAKRARLKLAEHKASIGCADCGERDPRVLQFHHRNPDEKEFTIGSQCGRKSIDDLLLEAEKCDVLCANCHIKRHVDPYEIS